MAMVSGQAEVALRHPGHSLRSPPIGMEQSLDHAQLSRCGHSGGLLALGDRQFEWASTRCPDYATEASSHGGPRRVGSGWTDSGESYDSRGLKKRARKATREVPIPPVLVRLIRDHVAEFGTAEDGRLFRAARGGGLLSKEYGDIWKAARRAVLTKQEVKTPLAQVPYGLRAACVSLWLESGVSPAEVARRAGHSIAVLFRFYAKAIHRSQQQANAQIEIALEAAEATTAQ
ncbi:hypothetical protein [Streptomyces erythrochromogenes]|uniref:hypothetical protein n=1 Tax=Streptomyces erythrochromogenes TaxID=285574 RepID=UPI0037FB0EC6